MAKKKSEPNKKILRGHSIIGVAWPAKCQRARRVRLIHSPICGVTHPPHPQPFPRAQILSSPSNELPRLPPSPLLSQTQKQPSPSHPNLPSLPRRRPHAGRPRPDRRPPRRYAAPSCPTPTLPLPPYRRRRRTLAIPRREVSAPLYL